MADDTITTYGAGGYDPSKPNNNVTATATVPVPPDEANRRTVTTQAAQALATNRTYVALAAPTNAQTTAQVKALTRQTNGLIRLILGQLDGTD